jgi:hypothetical protein
MTTGEYLSIKPGAIAPSARIIYHPESDMEGVILMEMEADCLLIIMSNSYGPRVDHFRGL